LLLDVLTVLIAIEHIGFLVLEMFLWTKPFGMRTFGTRPEFARESAALAANQGLYNGFLAAGLIWGLVTLRAEVVAFNLICVFVAGLYGGATAKWTIWVVQALPAAAALGVFWLAR
jgi:putative membrane protein